MSDDVLWGLLTGAWVGRRIRQNREATANAIGAAVAANLNPPHELTQEEIEALPEDERELLKQKHSIETIRKVFPNNSYHEPTMADIHHQNEQKRRREHLNSLTRDQLLDYLQKATKFDRITAINLLSPAEQAECKAQLKARRKTLRGAVQTALVSTIIIVLVSFLLWDSFGIAGNEMLFGAAAFIGLLIYMKTEKAILPVKIVVSIGLLVSLAISAQDTAVWVTTASGDFDVGLGMTLLGSIMATVAWGCECFHTAKAQAVTSYQ